MGRQIDFSRPIDFMVCVRVNASGICFYPSKMLEPMRTQVLPHSIAMR